MKQLTEFLVHSTPSINGIMSNSSRAVTFVTVITTNKIYSPVLAQPGLAHPQAGRLARRPSLTQHEPHSVFPSS